MDNAADGLCAGVLARSAVRGSRKHERARASERAQRGAMATSGPAMVYPVGPTCCVRSEEAGS